MVSLANHSASVLDSDISKIPPNPGDVLSVIP